MKSLVRNLVNDLTKFCVALFCPRATHRLPRETSTDYIKKTRAFQKNKNQIVHHSKHIRKHNMLNIRSSASVR